MKLRRFLAVVLIGVTLILVGCSHQISKNKIIRDFKEHYEAFGYVVNYIRDFDLDTYKKEVQTDLPLFVDFASVDFESGNPSLMVSAGWAPTVFDKRVEIDGEIVQEILEIFDLNYAYIGQVATVEKEPLVIYFRIDDVINPETDNPHGIAYTSNNLPPSVDNDNREIIYTEQIFDNWFYYENDVLKVD